MNQKQFESIINNVHSKRMDLLISKRHDYANEDILSNFKRVSILCGQLGIDVSTPFGANMFLVVLKLDRLMNLYRKKAKPENESVEDTYCDFHNYLDLALANYTEEVEEPKEINKK